LQSYVSANRTELASCPAHQYCALPLRLDDKASIALASLNNTVRAAKLFVLCRKTNHTATNHETMRARHPCAGRTSQHHRLGWCRDWSCLSKRKGNWSWLTFDLHRKEFPTSLRAHGTDSNQFVAHAQTTRYSRIGIFLCVFGWMDGRNNVSLVTT
jgi:hypothetical protein